MTKHRLDPMLLADLRSVLDRAQRDYKLHNDMAFSEKASQWLCGAFPVTSWGRVDWALVPGSVVATAPMTAQAVSQATSIASERGLLKKTIIVMWSNLIIPCLETTLETALEFGSDVFETDMDTWLMCLDEEWCFEHYHEGELGFGFSPKIASAAIP